MCLSNGVEFGFMTCTNLEASAMMIETGPVFSAKIDGIAVRPHVSAHIHSG